MKTTTTIALLGLLAFAFTASADVLIYKHKAAGSRTGFGQVVKSSFTGWTVMDPNTSDVGIFQVFTKTKRFSFAFPPVAFIDFVSGNKAASVSVVGVQPDGGNGFVFFKGATSKTALPQGLIVPWAIAKTLSVAGTVYYYNATSDSYFDDYKGTALYDQTDTIQANGLGLTFDSVVQAMRDALLNDGYTED